jgi:hypothetical protein
MGGGKINFKETSRPLSLAVAAYAVAASLVQAGGLDVELDEMQARAYR